MNSCQEFRYRGHKSDDNALASDGKTALIAIDQGLGSVRIAK
jgi:hypothetical protein